MSELSNNNVVSGEALVKAMESHSHLLSLMDYCYGLVNFELPEEAVRTIIAKRGVDYCLDYSEVDLQSRSLIEADIYTWICTGASKMSATSDSDNGWQHSGGGFTLTEADKKFLLNKANAIYEAYGEEKVGKTKIRVNSFGVMPAYRTCNGDYVEHVIR